MSDFATTPLTFTAASDYLAQKVDLPTELSSLDISLHLPARIRGQAFISAKVASATILQALRTEAAAIAQGDYSYAEGRLRMKNFLSTQGLGIPQPGTEEDHDVRTLPSTARLDLILRQNVAMAHAVGQREVAEHPAVLELLPCYEYSTGPNPRAEHAAFDGLVLPKTDAFWSTHYPPWDFNCNCLALDTDAEPNGKTSGFKAGTPAEGHLDYNGMRQLTGNESGFEFHSHPDTAFAKPDFSTIADDDLRAQVEDAWKGKAVVLGLGRDKVDTTRVGRIKPIFPPDVISEGKARLPSTESGRSAAEPSVAEPSVAEPTLGAAPALSKAAEGSRVEGRRPDIEQRAFKTLTKPLRAKLSFGDDVAWLDNGILHTGRISGPDDGTGLLVKTPHGSVRVARADLRHPGNFKASPDA